MKFDLNLTVREILAEPACQQAVEEVMPGLLPNLAQQPLAQGLSLWQLGKYLPQIVTPERLAALEEALRLAQPPEGTLTPGEAKKVASYRLLAAQPMPQRLMGQKEHKTAIRPGGPWYDTEGKRVQTHAGGLLFEDGWYYWYGENKAWTDGSSDIWTWGIRAYRSRDLCNWEDLGLIIPPDLENPASSLFPDRRVDRPHIVRCPATGRYVCWLKLSGKDASFTVLRAEKLLGPYEIVREGYQPFDLEVGDFDLVVDDAAGIAYIFLVGSDQGVYGLRLNGDFTSCEAIVSCQYENLNPPFTREGVTLFTWNGKKYMITSGMTGYLPNQSEVAVSDSWEEPFVPIGDPHWQDDTHASFNSQLSQVFRLPGSGQYISLADRWVPGCLLDGEKADLIRRVIASGSDPEHYAATQAERSVFQQMPMLESADTALSEYIWLPVEFVSGAPRIVWRDEWIPDLT